MLKNRKSILILIVITVLIISVIACDINKLSKDNKKNVPELDKKQLFVALSKAQGKEHAVTDEDIKQVDDLLAQSISDYYRFGVSNKIALEKLMMQYASGFFSKNTFEFTKNQQEILEDHWDSLKFFGTLLDIGDKRKNTYIDFINAYVSLYETNTWTEDQKDEEETAVNNLVAEYAEKLKDDNLEVESLGISLAIEDDSYVLSADSLTAEKIINVLYDTYENTEFLYEAYSEPEGTPTYNSVKTTLKKFVEDELGEAQKKLVDGVSNEVKSTNIALNKFKVTMKNMWELDDNNDTKLTKLTAQKGKEIIKGEIEFTYNGVTFSAYLKAKVKEELPAKPFDQGSNIFDVDWDVSAKPNNYVSAIKAAFAKVNKIAEIVKPEE